MKKLKPKEGVERKGCQISTESHASGLEPPSPRGLSSRLSWVLRAVTPANQSFSTHWIPRRCPMSPHTWAPISLLLLHLLDSSWARGSKLKTQSSFKGVVSKFFHCAPGFGVRATSWDAKPSPKGYPLRQCFPNIVGFVSVYVFVIKKQFHVEFKIIHSGVELLGFKSCPPPTSCVTLGRLLSFSVP